MGKNIVDGAKNRASNVFGGFFPTATQALTYGTSASIGA